MKIGSICECIDNNHYKAPESVVQVPALSPVTYTVRDIIPKGTSFRRNRYCITFIADTIFLEEIINPNALNTDIEVGYNLSDFRELIPPIGSVEEFINQNTEQGVEQVPEIGVY